LFLWKKARARRGPFFLQKSGVPLSPPLDGDHLGKTVLPAQDQDKALWTKRPDGVKDVYTTTPVEG